MCSIQINFEDGHPLILDNVTSAKYLTKQLETVEVSESEILTHPFPLKRPLWFISDGYSVTVNGDNIRVIQAYSE